jgi:hypothetical protein
LFFFFFRTYYAKYRIFQLGNPPNLKNKNHKVHALAGSQERYLKQEGSVFPILSPLPSYRGFRKKVRFKLHTYKNPYIGDKKPIQNAKVPDCSRYRPAGLTFDTCVPGTN